MMQGRRQIIAFSFPLRPGRPQAGQLSLLLSSPLSAPSFVFSLPQQLPRNRQDIGEGRVREDARALIQDRHRDVEQLLHSHPQEFEDRGRLGGRPLAAAGLLLGLGPGGRGLGGLLLLCVVVAVPPPRQSGRRDVFRRVVLHHEVNAAAAAAALEFVAGGAVPRARP